MFASTIKDEDGVQWLRASKNSLKVYRHTEDGTYIIGYYDKATNTVLNQMENLWSADKDCKHVIISAVGGGVKCTKCKGWLCH